MINLFQRNQNNNPVYLYGRIDMRAFFQARSGGWKSGRRGNSSLTFFNDDVFIVKPSNAHKWMKGLEAICLVELLDGIEVDLLHSFLRFWLWCKIGQYFHAIEFVLINFPSFFEKTQTPITIIIAATMIVWGYIFIKTSTRAFSLSRIFCGDSLYCCSYCSMRFLLLTAWPAPIPSNSIAATNSRIIIALADSESLNFQATMPKTRNTMPATKIAGKGENQHTNCLTVGFWALQTKQSNGFTFFVEPFGFETVWGRDYCVISWYKNGNLNHITKYALVAPLRVRTDVRRAVAFCGGDSV